MRGMQPTLESGARRPYGWSVIQPRREAETDPPEALGPWPNGEKVRQHQPKHVRCGVTAVIAVFVPGCQNILPDRVDVLARFGSGNQMSVPRIGPGCAITKQRSGKDD